MKRLFRKHDWQGTLHTSFRWLIPGLLGVSRSTIDEHTRAYAVHLTPYLEIMLNRPGR